MASATASRRLPFTLAGALLLAFFFQSFLAGRLKSPTADEPLHIGASLFYVTTGVIRPNPQHPPLLKELAGLSMLAAGIRYPNTWMARELRAGGSLQLLELPSATRSSPAGAPIAFCFGPAFRWSSSPLCWAW